MRLFILVLVLVGVAPAWAGNLYNVRHLSETELLKTYHSMMVDACHHSDKFWKTASFDKTAGYWGDGASDGNQGIRAVGDMVFVSGVLLKYGAGFNETERADYLAKSISALRFATATHVTGTQKCPDGKAWGNSWQSAMWTGTLGLGAWMMWDKIDPALQKDVERVIASEADRFLNGKPPGGSSNDTKAEENGWNLICISLAANMFPKHPHAAAWNEKVIEYMINTLSTPEDRTDKTIVDGKPVSAWFSGENIHSDFTLENHGFFHPAYVACSSYFLTQAAMHFTLANRPVPQAATHHLLDVWKMFQTIILPFGEPAYPQGMDWELHGITLINLFASLATYQKDPLAAELEQKCLQYMRAWQEMEKGDLAVPGSRLGFTRHAICAEQAAYGFLAHKIFGRPAPELSFDVAAQQLSGVHGLDAVEIVTHRTADKFVSFSWKNKMGGTLIPIGKGHEAQPHFSVPIVNGLIGSFELTPTGDTKTTVVEHHWKKTDQGFETTGTLLLNGDRLKQTLKVTSIGDHTVVYEDRVVSLTNITVAHERGVPIGIENDKVTGGLRMVFDQSGSTVFDWQKPRASTSVSGWWANVDGRIGVVRVMGSPMAYAQAAGYHPGTAVCADTLYASFSDHSLTIKKDEQVAHRVIIFYIESSAKKTAAMADGFTIRRESGHEVLRFKLPEGGEAELNLL